MRLRPAFTVWPRSRAVDSTCVMLPSEGSGRLPSASGALMLRPRSRLVPFIRLKLTLALIVEESCRLIPTLSIARFGMTRFPASVYLLGGRTC